MQRWHMTWEARRGEKETGDSGFDRIGVGRGGSPAPLDFVGLQSTVLEEYGIVVAGSDTYDLFRWNEHEKCR